MLDNEDVLSDSSAENQDTNEQPQSDPTPSEADGAESAQAPQKSGGEEDKQPFHLHPRFQEVIQEKNNLKEQYQALAKQFEQIQSQLKASQPQPKDELMERLKGIDPAFAERFGKLNEVDQLKQQLAEFDQWRQQSATQQLQQQIVSAKDKFYTENKVPSDRRDLYEAMASQIATANPKLQISDLPTVMKQVHDRIGKMFQTVERNTTKQFADGKKAEANRPAPLKSGAPAKSVKQSSAPISKEELLAELRKEAVGQVRADKEI